jgi:hypothetical protein
MVSLPSTARTTKVKCETTRRQNLGARKCALPIVAMVVALALSTLANAATITVNSLADPGAPGICALRDAITAANSQTKVNGCKAGSGNDTIKLSVSGTITLADTLPQLTDSRLNVSGPITIDGGSNVQVMQIADGATVTINNLTIADGVGGIENGGTLTVTKSTFSANSDFYGGGIFNNGGTLVVTNSTFSGNSGSIGGGIDNDGGGTLTITNSTFSSNNAALYEYGGDINAFATVTLKNTIVAGNSGAPNCFGTITDLGYNISDDSSCGFSKTGKANNGDNVNPMLSSDGLTNNGGPTQTIALIAGSPAIDVIPLADCTDQDGDTPRERRSPIRLKTDQRGFPRPDAGESVCDIGAFETQDSCSQNQQGNNNCQ